MSNALDRSDVMILSLGAVCAAATVGMVLDAWPVVFFAIPVVALLLCLLGSMRRDHTWGGAALVAVVAFGVGLLALFTWAALSMRSDTVIWGLQQGMAVFVYAIWPYTTLFSGLLYAFVYSTSLQEEINARAH